MQFVSGPPTAAVLFHPALMLSPAWDAVTDEEREPQPEELAFENSFWRRKRE